MILLDVSNFSDAADFFALEYAIAVTSPQDEFYFFWTTPPTLMLGRNQIAEQEINLNEATLRNIAIRRRFSGGGTIYTDKGTFLFSHLIINSSDISKQLALETQKLTNALCNLGIPASFNSRNDILINGQKVCGAAGYSYGKYYLYHTSLLWNANFSAIDQLLTVEISKMKRHGIQSVHQRVTSISDFCDMPFEEFKRRLSEEIVSSDPQSRFPNAEEIALMTEYKQRFFANEQWNMLGNKVQFSELQSF